MDADVNGGVVTADVGNNRSGSGPMGEATQSWSDVLVDELWNKWVVDGVGWID